jgi:predicted anti-sigma-YlaC factor YlaD
MSTETHNRAQQLLSQSLVEGLSAADQAWLDAHLHECPACSRGAAGMLELVRSFRNVPVVVPGHLVARTQMRVRLRAQEAAQASTTGAWLWIITAASWVLGVVSAPLVWRVFAWAGAQLDLPKLVLQLGFVLWWAVPGLIALTIVLYQRGTSRRFVRPSIGRDGEA